MRLILKMKMEHCRATVVILGSLPTSAIWTNHGESLMKSQQKLLQQLGKLNHLLLTANINWNTEFQNKFIERK